MAIRGLFGVLLAGVATLATPALAEDRALHVQLSASISGGSRTGDVSRHWNDLLTNEFGTEGLVFETACVGDAHLGVDLTYAREPLSAIRVTGDVTFFKGRRCGDQVAATQHVEVRLPWSSEQVVTIDIPTPQGDRAFGMLTLQNFAPSCAARKIRWRAHMRVQDDDHRSAEFDSRQFSILLEPGEVPGVKMRRGIDANEVEGILETVFAVTSDGQVSARSTLELNECRGWFDWCPDINDRAHSMVVMPSQAEPRVETMVVHDSGNRVDATISLENYAPETCGVSLAPIFVMPSSGILYFPRCMIQGCFPRANGRGWIRFGETMCDASGCTVSGEFDDVLCPGQRLTFAGAAVSADCREVRFALPCLRNERGVFRLTKNGASFQRGSRTPDPLTTGGKCQ